MSAYDQVEDGVPFDLRGTTHLQCCDCGLVHQLSVRRAGKKLMLTVKRDDRATAQVRRHSKIKVSRKKP